MKRLLIILGLMFVTGVGLAQTAPNGIIPHQAPAVLAKAVVIQAKSSVRFGSAFTNKKTVAGKSSRQNSFGHGSLSNGPIGEVDSSETVEASISYLEPPETEIERVERLSGIPSRP
ncbi:MAG TPA: hypothetical protein VK791_03535 [bacterium]|jgi:hypothetical protein|nr:hypothetical protein [bacterium]